MGHPSISSYCLWHLNPVDLTGMLEGTQKFIQADLEHVGAQ